MALLAPSILAADFLKLEEQIDIVEKNGADYIHIDVMDGHFVPNITFGPFMVEACKRITKLPLDVHLMISEPEKYVQSFADAGSDIITVHQETCAHLDRVIQMIRETGRKPGVAINPATSVNSLESVLSEIDLALIMTVNPGFGGQKFIPYTLDKIRKLRSKIDTERYNVSIEVDGGINSSTIEAAFKAGADVLVAGNAIFKSSDIGKTCAEFKKKITSILT